MIEFDFLKMILMELLIQKNYKKHQKKSKNSDTLESILSRFYLKAI